MLTLRKINDLLADVGYRPGWEFSTYEDEYEGPHIRIVATLINGYDTNITTDIGVNSPLPPFETEKEFLRWLSWRLRRIESHESREFFRYKGQLVSDPHQESEILL